MVQKLQPTSEDDLDDNDSEHGMDETAAFLAGFLQESTEDYDTEKATAMMMNDALLLDDITSVSTRVRSFHEVPRSSLDENRGDQKHVEGEHGPVQPEAGSNLGKPSTHEVPCPWMKIRETRYT
jgi:hypothetical protein